MTRYSADWDNRPVEFLPGDGEAVQPRRNRRLTAPQPPASGCGPPTGTSPGRGRHTYKRKATAMSWRHRSHPESCLASARLAGADLKYVPSAVSRSLYDVRHKGIGLLFMRVVSYVIWMTRDLRYKLTRMGMWAHTWTGPYRRVDCIKLDRSKYELVQSIFVGKRFFEIYETRGEIPNWFMIEGSHLDAWPLVPEDNEEGDRYWPIMGAWGKVSDRLNLVEDYISRKFKKSSGVAVKVVITLSMMANVLQLVWIVRG